MVKIAPSLLAANISCLGNEIQRLEKAYADMLHFDVMDGHFVPNITYGPHILKELKKQTYLNFDVHLMVENPERFIPWFLDAGADIITFHLETTKNPTDLISLIHSHGVKAGVSLKPDTDIYSLSEIKNDADLILVMGVEPGFGGQQFREDTPQRIAFTKKVIDNTSTLIEIDGGINPTTAKLCINAGADILVAGTSVFKNDNYAQNIQALKGE